MILSRKKIEAALRGHVASPGLSIREALETALALYQENERLNGESKWYHEDAQQAYQCLSNRNSECERLERENARLREELETEEDENDVVKMECRAVGDLQREVEALRAVVEAVRTFAKCDCEKNSIDSHWNDVLAALKGLEGK